MTNEDLTARIRDSVQNEQFRLSAHAEIEREADQITVAELVEALTSPGLHVVEDYPNDPRGISCLDLGFTEKRQPIHAVCGLARDMLVVITVYRPDPEQWTDSRIRKEISQ